jgi:hypothetical protein
MGPTRLTTNNTPVISACQAKMAYGLAPSVQVAFEIARRLEQDYHYISDGRVMKRILLTAAAFILYTGSSCVCYGQVSLRLKGGWPIPNSQFDQKDAKIFERGDEYTFDTKGINGFSADLAFAIGNSPFDLTLSAGYWRFDDIGHEIAETAYDKPAGTGRFTDFQHRFIPLTVSLELMIAYADWTHTTVGVGFGNYNYEFFDSADLMIVEQSSDSFWGWQLAVAQAYTLTSRFGICFEFEYHSLSSGEDSTIGLAPAGIITQISFYTIQLGILVKVIN